MTKNVLILDDDSLHRHYMCDLIKQHTGDDAHVWEAGNAQEAMKHLSTQPIDLCIFDLQLPDKSGIDVAKEVWDKDQSMRILFWSQHSDELYVRKLFSIVPEKAVYGFLIKTALEDQILNAIQYILDYDQCWIDPKIRKVKNTTFDKNTGLTDVEYETLVDLALGLSDNAIAQRRFITKRGVQNRLASLYSKLGVTDEQYVSDKWGNLFSPRTRAVTLSVIRGLINQQALDQENQYLQQWTNKYV
ncbi:response regulator transcription factor [bacterium]|nr:MAG: response regulator transcription factor [bacterium]